MKLTLNLLFCHLFLPTRLSIKWNGSTHCISKSYRDFAAIYHLIFVKSYLQSQFIYLYACWPILFLLHIVLIEQHRSELIFAVKWKYCFQNLQKTIAKQIEFLFFSDQPFFANFKCSIHWTNENEDCEVKEIRIATIDSRQERKVKNTRFNWPINITGINRHRIKCVLFSFYPRTNQWTSSNSLSKEHFNANIKTCKVFVKCPFYVKSAERWYLIMLNETPNDLLFQSISCQSFCCYHWH